MEPSFAVALPLDLFLALEGRSQVDVRRRKHYADKATRLTITSNHPAAVHGGALKDRSFARVVDPVCPEALIRCVLPGPRFRKHYLVGLGACWRGDPHMPGGHWGHVLRYGREGRYWRHSARVRLRPAMVQAVRTQSAGSAFHSSGFTSDSENMVPALLTAIGSP